MSARGTGPRWVRLAIVGVLLPLLAAAVLVWSVSGREKKLDKIPVAVVNNDTILTDPQPMAAGRALTASLTNPKSSNPNLDWTLTNTDDARAGLKDGSYYAVLTIPTDFSSAIISSGSDKPVQGQLTLVSNAAASSTVPYISEQIAAAAAGSLGDQTTQGYLKNVYDGFNQIAKSNSSAASSATQLADGTDQLSSGAAKLDDGNDSLAESLGQVASGTAELHAGVASVASGAAEVDRGAAGVSQGARKLHSGAAALAQSTRTLAGRSTTYAGKADDVAVGARGLSRATARVASGSKAVAGDLGGLADQCATAGGSVSFCADLRAAHTRSSALATGSALTDRLAGGVATATTGLAAGAHALADADGRVAHGAQSLSSASAKLSSGAAKVASGAASVARGAASLDGASDQLVDGTAESASAATSLAGGSATLSSSATQVDQGAQSLSGGLTKGAQESPTYSTSQQDALATAVAQPVELHHSLQHAEHGYGWLLAAIVAVILWLAALVGALGVDLSTVLHNALTPVSSRRIALTLAVPVVGLAVVQAVAVVLGLTLLQASTAALLPLALLCVLAAVSFSLLANAMRLAWGGLGIVVYVLFLLVQVAALGNVVPVETAPSLIQVLNGLLPLTVFANGASQIVMGGSVVSIVAVVTVMALWGLAAFAAMVVTVKRRRMLRSPSRSASTTLETVA